MKYLNPKKIIIKQIKKNKSTLYGAKAIKKHIGPLARPTQDFDILTKTPRKAARQLTKTLNKQAGNSPYFSKPAMHPGTFKVKHKGMDKKKNTQDDLEVADFTKPKRKFKTTTMGGVKVVKLPEIVKDKKKALADKEFAFRHAKDKEDLSRIKLAKEFNVKYRGEK